MKKNTPLVVVIGIIVIICIALVIKNQNKSGGVVQEQSQRIYPSTPTTSLSPETETPVITPRQSSVLLTISSPKNGTVVSTSQIAVRGQTAPNAEVFVNDVSGTADAKGNFVVSIALDEGDNTVIVVANDASGNFTEQEVIVSYNPGT